MHRPVFEPSSASWLMTEDGFDQRRIPHYETVFALCNGYAGLRASPEMTPGLGDPGMYIAGVFDQIEGFSYELVNLPCWIGVRANMDGFEFDLRKGEVLEYRRVLDMRKGLLFTDIVWRDGAKRRTRWQSVRLMHLGRKHLGIVWGAITPLDYSGTLCLSSPIDAWLTKHGSGSGLTHYRNIAPSDLGDGRGVGLSLETARSGIGIGMAASLRADGADGRRLTLDDDRVAESFSVPIAKGRPACFEKRAVWYTSRDGEDPAGAAAKELACVGRHDLGSLVAEHVGSWHDLWDASDVRVGGDARAQRALRWNLFHLGSLANPDDDRASLGAKGLHGNGYQGLIFWDTEIYLAPFFTYTNPDAAEALLRYRCHLLSDARENARELGCRGAFFPWNTSIIGRGRSWRGWQEHVGADIAYAVDQYVRATGDAAFYLDCGARLIIETAQYWPDRVEYDPARKCYNLRRLTGSDEIHTGIDNNAFTNHLVRWHLARAARAVAELKAAGMWEAMSDGLGITDADVAEWLRIAEGLRDLYSPEHGFHEQFEGYFGLPDRAIDRSMTKMQYTGPVQHSFKPTRVAQQADTLMMYYLFPDDFADDVRRRGFEFYEPRCSHTSTLSRCIFAAVAAQTGLADEAYRLFLESLETDIGPRGECESGIHLACTGGNWQAAVMGFAGFGVKGGLPSFDPHLPRRWRTMAFRLVWRERTLEVRITPGAVRLRTRGGTIGVLVGGRRREVGPRARVFACSTGPARL